MKIGRLTLQSTHLSDESFLVELGRKFQNNPNEGDVVSLTMFVECIEMRYWRESRVYDPRTEWAAYARRLADECGNGRLKYRLLVSFSSPYDLLLIKIKINRILQSCARNFRS